MAHRLQLLAHICKQSLCIGGCLQGLYNRGKLNFLDVFNLSRKHNMAGAGGSGHSLWVRTPLIYLFLLFERGQIKPSKRKMQYAAHADAQSLYVSNMYLPPPPRLFLKAGHIPTHPYLIHVI